MVCSAAIKLGKLHVNGSITNNDLVTNIEKICNVLGDVVNTQIEEICNIFRTTHIKVLTLKMTCL